MDIVSHDDELDNNYKDFDDKPIQD